MQLYLVKHGVNAVLLQVLDQPRPRAQILDQRIEQTEVGGAVLRDRLERTADFLQRVEQVACKAQAGWPE